MCVDQWYRVSDSHITHIDPPCLDGMLLLDLKML